MCPFCWGEGGASELCYAYIAVLLWSMSDDERGIGIIAGVSRKFRGSFLVAVGKGVRLCEVLRWQDFKNICRYRRHLHSVVNCFCL